MTRQTSIAAFYAIKENGLISKRRWEVYEILFKLGPLTCRETLELLKQKNGANSVISFSSYTSRFSELQRLGLITEVGHRENEKTGRTGILWDVTSNLPKEIKKVKKEKCSHCMGSGYEPSFDELL